MVEFYATSGSIVKDRKKRRIIKAGKSWFIKKNCPRNGVWNKKIKREWEKGQN